MKNTINKQAALELMLSGSLADYIAYIKMMSAK